MIRKHGIPILLGSAILAVIWALLFGERFIEAEIERAASKILSTRVEIDNLRIYRDPALSFDKLRIVDPHNPRQNLIEIGYTGFFLEARPLLYGKAIIDEMRLTDIKFWTPREIDSSSAIAATPPKQAAWISGIEDALHSQIKTPPIGTLLVGEEIPAVQLISLLDLKALQHLDKIAAEVDSTYDHWQAYLSETETTSNSNGRGSNNDVATSLKARLRQAQQRANSDFERLAIEIRATNDQIQRDVRNVKNRSVVFKIAPDWIGKMLYGDLAIQAITEILRYVDLVRKNMPVANLRFQNVKLENPPRGAGQNIYFPISDSDPKFLIKNLILRSPENQKEAKDKLRVRGEITGFTSHPEVYREMQQIEVSSRYPDPRKYGIVASIDHSKDEPWEQFQLLGTGLKLFSFDLPDYPYLPNHIITDHGKLSGGVEITGDRIDCRIGVTAIPAIFRFEKTAPADSAIVNKIRSEIESQKRYFVGVRLQGTFDELSMKVYSSIDIHLAPEVEKILGRKAKWEPREVSATVDSILTAKKNEVTQLFDKRKTAIRHQISQYEKLLQ